MKKAFISYSWKDEAIALRLYRDIKRMNINIWLDRIDGEPTGDFKQEFLRRIRDCDFFIVIDSENYRYNSNWCYTELKACFGRIEEHQKVSMIVCLANMPGKWRNTDCIQDGAKQKLYERLNTQKYFVLCHNGTYDNERAYFVALESIQRVLGKESFTWDMFPEESDIIDELGAELKSHSEICDDDRESLKSAVRSIVLRRNQHRDITKHLQLLIDDCKEQNLFLFLPYWMYSIWLAEDRHAGKFNQECFNNLKFLAAHFPKEPRVYRALGGISARLEQQKQAANYYLTALGLIDDSQKTIRCEVLFNLGQVYMNLQRYNNAKKTFEEAFNLLGNNTDEINSTFVVSYYDCLMLLGKKLEAGAFIKEKAKEYLSASDIQLSCGFHFLKCKQVSTALSYFYRSYILNPSKASIYGYLCGLLNYGNTRDYEMILSNALSKPPITEDDFFWQAQIAKLPR
jgi:tetratricopeptide (TPR) repeat protein